MAKIECRQRAKELALKILPASASVLDLNYAIAQITPLYEMIAEAEAVAERADENYYDNPSSAA